MTTIRGHFDGKVIVPDEPVDLPRDQALVVHVDLADRSPARTGTPGPDLLRFAGIMSAQEAAEMLTAIADCAEIDAHEW